MDLNVTDANISVLRVPLAHTRDPSSGRDINGRRASYSSQLSEHVQLHSTRRPLSREASPLPQSWTESRPRPTAYDTPSAEPSNVNENDLALRLNTVSSF